MNKLLITLAVITCTTTFTFASSQLSERNPSLDPAEEAIYAELGLNEETNRAVRQTLLSAEEKKRVIMREARKQLKQLETEKSDQLAALLSEDQLANLNKLRSEVREKHLAKRQSASK